MSVTWSWPVFLDVLIFVVMLVIPMGAEDWQDALKSSVGLAFAAGGAGILLSGVEGEILVTALILLSAAVLLEVQAAMGPEHRSRPYLVWATAMVIIAGSPWGRLIAWLDDARLWLGPFVLMVVGRLAVAASRRHLRDASSRPDPDDQSDS